MITFFLCKLIKNNQSGVEILIESCFSILLSMLYQFPKIAKGGCFAGISVCNITVDGHYMPCTQLNYKEKYSSIQEYWDSSIVLNELRKSKKENLKYCCNCNQTHCNFCRAMSLNSHNDFKVGYNLCPIREEN